MKAIINRKRYDTDASEKLAGWDNGMTGRDHGNCTERLYKTKAGAYFIAGEGGPMSKYARSAGNNCTSGGEGITPLTRDQACQWCEDHGLAEAIDQHFGDLVADA